jgi:SpoIID/LytB domain protein
MTPTSLRRTLAAFASVCALALVGVTAPPPVPAAGAVATSDFGEGSVSFVGHGWGHGRGMGQYGALGYAVDHGWGYQQILDHYYGGTATTGGAPATIGVELLAHTSAISAMGRGLVVNGFPQADAGAAGSAVRVLPAANGGFDVYVGPSCSGPWSPAGSSATVTIATSAPNDVSRFVRTCESGGERSYRGSLTVRRHNQTARLMVVNEVATEDYLRGVVPRESPDGWGSRPNGMEALKAQAVAARSYALSQQSARPSGAQTCDTTTCQVYLGAAFQPNGGARTSLEGPNADRAIAATAGQVRYRPGTAPVQIVRTEFSSSTGGWTAGGTFPAVEDAGDSTASNPNHTWSASFTLPAVAQALGMGPITRFEVTQRNGLGAEGGRVLQVAVTGGGTTRTFTGNQIRTMLGLKSDWFTPTLSVGGAAAAQSVVRALYQDLLGRGPDPTGLAGWSAALVSGATGQPALVASLTRSEEYVALRVSNAYMEALGRGPDPQGARDWAREIHAGRATVDDVKRRFYDSSEFFARSGGTPQGYVQVLYQTMLGRGAAPSEVDAWVRVMEVKGRSRMVDELWFSMEAARMRAGGYYATFLQRGPDPTGLTAWAQVLLAQGEGAVRVGIAGSQEYRTLAQTRFP